MKIFSIWNKRSTKVYDFYYYPKLWKKMRMSSNGAKKGIDKNYDFQIWFLGFCFNYVNFEYNKK